MNSTQLLEAYVSNALVGKRIAFLVANIGVEQVALTEPWQAVEGAGGQPVLLAPDDENVRGVNNDLELADTLQPDLKVSDASVDDYAGLVLPGGVANPDKLRLDQDAVD
jgi:protease I